MSTWGITPGRSLRWSPAWTCSTAAVLFDARSGDYWVLSEEGQRVVRALDLEGPLESDDLLGRVHCSPPDALALLEDLAHGGIIKRRQPSLGDGPEPGDPRA